MIYVFSQPGLQCNLKNAFLVDQKLIYTTNITEPFSYDNHVIEYDKSYVTDDLLSLALASGEFSRFKIDRKLPVDSYKNLYTRWIEQSVTHSIATEVFCYMINERPKGLVTINRKGSVSEIGLVATDKAFRGQGIGNTLLDHVKHFVYEQKCEVLNVATQNQNKAACHLYEKAGFKISSFIDVWHWWL